MKTIATWIRPVDEDLYAAAFAFAPGVRLVNARTTKTDVASADALLLTGGGDVGADYLKQPVSDASLVRGTDALRDVWEFAAVAPFITSGRPILAICRGHQVLNVVLGGTLLLDIPGHAGEEQKNAQVQPLRHADGVPEHRRFTMVNSSHHQAVDRLGDGLVAEAWCDTDGIVEQVCDRTHPWCVGVQYHPERDQAYASLFRAFVDAMG